MKSVLASPVDFSMIEWLVEGDSTKTLKQTSLYLSSLHPLLHSHTLHSSLSPFPTFSFYLLNVAGRLHLTYNFQSINSTLLSPHPHSTKLSLFNMVKVTSSLLVGAALFASSSTLAAPTRFKRSTEVAASTDLLEGQDEAELVDEVTAALGVDQQTGSVGQMIADNLRKRGTCLTLFTVRERQADQILLYRRFTTHWIRRYSSWSPSHSQFGF